jgi:hypothetical protein
MVGVYVLDERIYGQSVTKPIHLQQQKKFSKVIYADDGTYFQSHITGSQKALNLVETFATASGIGSKPKAMCIQTVTDHQYQSQHISRTTLIIHYKTKNCSSKTTKSR